MPELPVYLSPIVKTLVPFEKDDDGVEWGFSEYAELLIRDVADADAMDALAKRLVVRWCRVSPYPHYRVTRQRFLELSRGGAVSVDEATAQEIREGWMMKEAAA